VFVCCGFFPQAVTKEVKNILVVFNYHRVSLVATYKLQALKGDSKSPKWFWKTSASWEGWWCARPPCTPSTGVLGRTHRQDCSAGASPAQPLLRGAPVLGAALAEMEGPLSSSMCRSLWRAQLSSPKLQAAKTANKNNPKHVVTSKNCFGECPECN